LARIACLPREIMKRAIACVRGIFTNLFDKHGKASRYRGQETVQ
jgi:hypothetical protein